MAISKARIERSTSDALRYRWDDWNVDDAEEPVDPSSCSSSVPLRANIAFAGPTEWIVFRFELMLDDLPPFD